MTKKSATLRYDGLGLRFHARTVSGHDLVVDNELGNTGPRPTELLVVAIAACTAMDVISILHKKRQTVTSYEVFTEGEQLDAHPHAFTRIDITHRVTGPTLDEEAVRRSIELSATRYCAITATLATGIAEIHHRFVVRRGTGGNVQEIEGEVVVTGPHMPIEAFGEEQAGLGVAAKDARETVDAVIR
jgi:putative redox protein